MTDQSYSRQQARKDKRDILKALQSLGRGDTGPADRLTSEPTEMDRRTFLATSVAAVTVAPALPAPAGPLSWPTAACLPTSIERPRFVRFAESSNMLGGGGDHFQERAARIAAMRAKEGN